MRSPLATPRACSALASRELLASNWPKVQLRTVPSVASTIRASASLAWRSQIARPMLKWSGFGQRNWRIASS